MRLLPAICLAWMGNPGLKRECWQLGTYGAACKLTAEAPDASQQWGEQRQGLLTSGKDAAAPQLLSADSSKSICD